MILYVENNRLANGCDGSLLGKYQIHLTIKNSPCGAVNGKALRTLSMSGNHNGGPHFLDQ